ncbi:MAG: methyltransferase domain-containing protein [Acidobacteria bacterium]|nr:MAG: methyltransferase domain-containing protein [Acidobacteriota bacterium]
MKNVPNDKVVMHAESTPREIDALTSATLKHLRDRWWDASFTQFLQDTLQPRAGNRILDVGCGTGKAEVSLGGLGLSQVTWFGIDRIHSRVHEAAEATASHNIRAALATADASHLPFVNDAFDSTFSVAVLQHIKDLDTAVREFARVTKPGGRVLVVEPDNSARYWYSSVESGERLFELGALFFKALAEVRDTSTELAVGPQIPGIFVRQGIEPTAVRLFPVASARLGAPPASVWSARRRSVREAIETAPDESIRRLGTDYVKLLDRYAEEAKAAGNAFVEIPHTMLFATVGQRQLD